MIIAIGNDHVAVELKKHITKYLTDSGHTVINFGTDSNERTDYPIYGKAVALAVKNGEADKGILICGTGVGISLAANKIRGIRAVVCSEPYSAQLAVEHNNANILAFGARVIGSATAETLVSAFLNAKFEGGRHERRVDMLKEIEDEQYELPIRN